MNKIENQHSEKTVCLPSVPNVNKHLYLTEKYSNKVIFPTKMVNFFFLIKESFF